MASNLDILPKKRKSKHDEHVIVEITVTCNSRIHDVIQLVSRYMPK